MIYVENKKESVGIFFMADGYFERGEIYWVKMGSGIGAEMNVTRPGLVVSCQDVNNSSDTVLIVFLTTKPHRVEWNRVITYCTGRESWVLCDQIQTVDKSRLTKYIGAMPQPDLRMVEDALEQVFDLGYTDDGALKEKDREIEARDALIAEKNAEIEALKRQLNAAKYDRENLETSYKVENDMWQGLYGKALDQLIEMKLTGDIQRRIEKPKVEEPVIEEAEVE